MYSDWGGGGQQPGPRPPRIRVRQGLSSGYVLCLASDSGLHSRVDRRRKFIKETEQRRWITQLQVLHVPCHPENEIATVPNLSAV